MTPRRAPRSRGDEGRAEAAHTDAGDRHPGPDVPDGPHGPDAELLDLIDHLGGLLERSDLAELEIEAGATSILLRRAEAAPAPATRDPSAPPAMEGPKRTESTTADPTGPRTHRVLAPLTGIFYAAPTPEAPHFVDVGGEVVVGQVIGLIEAMKLFNEIKSDVAGRVQRVMAESGQLVKARDPLIELALTA